MNKITQINLFEIDRKQRAGLSPESGSRIIPTDSRDTYNSLLDSPSKSTFLKGSKSPSPKRLDDCFNLLIYIQPEVEGVHNNKIVQAMRSYAKVYIKISNNRPEFNTLSCNAFMELYRGMNRIVTFKLCTGALFRMANIVMEGTAEINELFSTSSILEQPDMEIFSFIENYFNSEEVDMILSSYLDSVEPLCSYFAKYERDGNQNKFISHLYHFLKTIKNPLSKTGSPGNSRSPGVSSSKNSPVANGRISPRSKSRKDSKKSSSPSKHSKPTVFFAEPVILPRSSEKAAAQRPIQKRESESKKLRCLSSGYAPVVCGFLVAFRLNNKTISEFPALNDKIKNHLSEDWRCPSKQISQMDLNSTCHKIVLSKIPELTEDSLKKMQLEKPLNPAIAEFVLTGDLDRLASRLKDMLRKRLRSEARYPGSPMRLDVYDSPQHFSCSMTHKAASPDHRRFQMVMRRMMSGELKVKKRSDKTKNKKKQPHKMIVFRGNSHQDCDGSGIDDEVEMSVIASSVNSSSISQKKYFEGEGKENPIFSKMIPRIKEILDGGYRIVENRLLPILSPEEMNRMSQLYNQV